MEEEYSLKLSQVSVDKSEDEVTSSTKGPRPGQDQLDETLSDFEKRLEALKGKFGGFSSDLSIQLEKAKRFQDGVQGLLAWVSEADKEQGELKVLDPCSTAIEDQLKKCKVCAEHTISL